MPFLSILYTIVISPLELLFEIIFNITNKVVNNEIVSIVFLSIAVNLLVLPLYKRADELQKEEREIQNKMAYYINHIKKTFKGDERFLMLQEYYRINHYKPIYALKSSISLLLQIPFFIAAYNLLSGMQSLHGMSFGFISDLGKEDALIVFGGIPINVLPILMTIINIISGYIYTKGHPLKEKIQIYGIAVVFLVLLYRSPSGLVFYWIINNVFSLIKNILSRLALSKNYMIVFSLVKKKLLDLIHYQTIEKRNSIFICGSLIMALLTGFVIPSNVISASTIEFVDAIRPSNPFFYVVNSMLLSFGSWVLWGSVFYFLVNDRVKTFLSKGVCVVCGISVCDYLLFGTKLGIISSTLQYENTLTFTVIEHIFNIFMIVVVCVLIKLLYSKVSNIINMLLIVGMLSVVVVGTTSTAEILGTYSVYSGLTRPSSKMPEISMSKNGKNVVVLMIDRAIGSQVPYIFNEKPELKESFDGFTYYPNTISYGAHTIFAAPALFGGYEYTPERINKRSEESLESKHDEALKVMPVVFNNNGYDVTIFDPPYAGYEWVPDLSIYDDYPSFHCYNTEGRFSLFEDGDNGFNSHLLSERIHKIRNRNLFLFAIMKISPIALQGIIYDDGLYNESTSTSIKVENDFYNPSIVQHISGLSIGQGYDYEFINSYPVLTNLTNITRVNEDVENSFIMMTNDTTHSPCLLQKPDYIPALYVDNTEYDMNMNSCYIVDGNIMKMNDEEQITHYHVNMATFIQLGKWFDYLRENGVYDNTRIILVSDHSISINQFSIEYNSQDMEEFLPLLMVKDFNATGFTVSNELMTNADTPSLATAELIDNPINPFTGNIISSDSKQSPQLVFKSNYWDVDYNKGNTFLPGSWYAVAGDPHNPSNWSYVGDG